MGFDFASELQIDHQELVGVVKSLLVDRYVTDEPISKTWGSLSEEAQQICIDGSPEFRVYSAIPPEGISIADLNSALGANVGKIGLGQCMKVKWVKKEGEKIIRVLETGRDETAEVLRKVERGESVPEKTLQELKKRKL